MSKIMPKIKTEIPMPKGAATPPPEKLYAHVLLTFDITGYPSQPHAVEWLQKAIMEEFKEGSLKLQYVTAIESATEHACIATQHWK
jgi:hypothetical protein